MLKLFSVTMPGDEGFDSGNSYWGGNLTIAVLNGTVSIHGSLCLDRILTP